LRSFIDELLGPTYNGDSPELASLREPIRYDAPELTQEERALVELVRRIGVDESYQRLLLAGVYSLSVRLSVVPEPVPVPVGAKRSLAGFKRKHRLRGCPVRPGRK
jgi:hypothetical protein